jgi:hypothetical protein
MPPAKSEFSCHSCCPRPLVHIHNTDKSIPFQIIMPLWPNTFRSTEWRQTRGPSTSRSSANILLRVARGRCVGGSSIGRRRDILPFSRRSAIRRWQTRSIGLVVLELRLRSTGETFAWAHFKLDLGSNEPTRQLSDEYAETGQEWVQTGDDYPQIFRTWVQLQVKYFQSLAILSKLSCQPRRETILKLFPATPDGVQPSTGGGGGISYAQAVINCLEMKILQGNAKDTDRIFRAFGGDLFRFIGNLL